MKVIFYSRSVITFHPVVKGRAPHFPLCLYLSLLKSLKNQVLRENFFFFLKQEVETVLLLVKNSTVRAA